jgi:hypothetical protein
MSVTSRKPGESASDWAKCESEVQNYLALKARLEVDERNMITWLCTGLRNVVTYPGVDRNTKQKIQDQLDKANDFIVVIYVWALLDEHDFNENSRWVSDEKKLELKAWKHIRHTGAHAPGGRAKGYRKAFNQYMRPGVTGSLSGLRENCSFTSDSIDLAHGMSFGFFNFAKDAVNGAIGLSANHKVPPWQAGRRRGPLKTLWAMAASLCTKSARFFRRLSN